MLSLIMEVGMAKVNLYLWLSGNCLPSSAAVDFVECLTLQQSDGTHKLHLRRLVRLTSFSYRIFLFSFFMKYYISYWTHTHKKKKRSYREFPNLYLSYSYLIIK